jgi:predicted phosphodiesterase
MLVAMTRIAVIADIHANVPALEAVLADVAAADVDELLVNGDLVGRGPLGSAVVHRVRELGLRSSRGNHEDYQLQFRRGEVPEDWLTADAWSCARWMANELSEADLEFIDALPFTLTSELETQVRLFHGSPTSHSEGIGRWTEVARVREHVNSIEETVLVVAHTHRPFLWRDAGRTVVNVGSVGLPFNGDTRAQYAILEGTGVDFDVEHRQVPYDPAPLLAAYQETGFLEQGNATAYLLRIELLSARPHLVPFLRWCDHVGYPALLAHVDEFMSVYDPDLSMAEFGRLIGR